MEILKTKFRSFLRVITKYDTVWDILLPVVQIAKRISMEREHWIPGKINEGDANLKLIFSDLKVSSGPFKGLRYPEFLAHGSYLYPKLIGSYEQELHPIIDKLCLNNYSEVLDVGCAEGYYAIGLALRLPNSKVYAYDIDRYALDSCKRMAEINGVLEQVNFEAFCDSQLLENFRFRTRGLIVCDCEGYEAELFTDSAVRNLKRCDLLIELHDCIKEGITEQMLSVFSRTHTAILITQEKRNIRNFPVLNTLNKFTKRYALDEGRPGNMRWAFLAAKGFLEN